METKSIWHFGTDLPNAFAKILIVYHNGNIRTTIYDCDTIGIYNETNWFTEQVRVWCYYDEAKEPAENGTLFETKWYGNTRYPRKHSTIVCVFDNSICNIYFRGDGDRAEAEKELFTKKVIKWCYRDKAVEWII